MDFELDLDFLKSFISDFDLMSILPDLADVMEWIVKGVNIALIIGPVLLAILGLWYLLLPTREANHFVGYRFFWGMGSVKSWKFTQRLAGLVWIILGAYLANEAKEMRDALMSMEKLDMMYEAVVIILRQISYVVVSCLAINVAIFLIFNYKGKVRRLWCWLGRSIRDLFFKLVDKIKESISNKGTKAPQKTVPAPAEAKPEQPRNKPKDIPKGMSFFGIYYAI